MVINPSDPGAAEDIATAEQKLQAVHASLMKDDLVRWTLTDIPVYAEEPYVAMAAFLAGPEYEKPVSIYQWAYGHSEIEKAVQRRYTGASYAEYF